MKHILGEGRFYFAQCVFNTSCHYSAVDRYEKQRTFRLNLAMGITILTIIIMIATILCWECNNTSWLKMLSVISTISSGVSLSFEFYNRADLTEVMFYHKQAAEHYKTLREKFMDLIRQIKSEVPETITEGNMQLNLHDYSLIGRYALQTTSQDYKSAQKKLGLNGGSESFTWSNEEIDRFLPTELRETT